MESTQHSIQPGGDSFSFSRWREKVPKADEGGASDDVFALPGATLSRGATHLDPSRQRERWIRNVIHFSNDANNGTSESSNQTSA